METMLFVSMSIKRLILPGYARFVNIWTSKDVGQQGWISHIGIDGQDQGLSQKVGFSLIFESILRAGFFD